MVDFWKTPRSILVTGASSGLGRQIAIELARRGHSVFLTGRNSAELERTLDACRNFRSISAEFFAVDLTEDGAIEALFERIEGLRWTIDAIVNNAGIGLIGEFSETDRTDELNVLRLNVVVPLELTKRALGAWWAGRTAAILNVGSTGAFQPGPLTSVYYASKAFLRSWSQAIAYELKPNGITVTIVSPGALATDFSAKAGKRTISGAQSPRFAAVKIVRAWMNARREYTPGWGNKLVVALSKVLPAPWLAAIVHRIQTSVRSTEKGPHGTS